MSTLSLAGSCLCGSIAYEIEGGPSAFNHCHCSRCRKATGTGHASNILLKPTAVRWITGEEHLRRYKVPAAKRFASVYCHHCGSPMPRIADDMSIAVIPAGSLDNNPGIPVQRRIFQASRAEWSCAGDELPTYDRYPPKD